MKTPIVILLTAVAFASCSKQDVKLSGRFVGAGDKMVYLESVTPARSLVVDSVQTDSKGQFKFRILPEEDQPTIFNLICVNEKIPLLLSPGERVHVSSVGSIAKNYRVEGSEESKLVAEINGILSDGALTLDSINNRFSSLERDADSRREFTRKYMEEYYRVKRRQLRFIMENPGSLAAVYALYQRLPGDETLFNGEGDLIYYQMVADSVEKTYPQSRYLVALRSQINAAQREAQWSERMLEKVKTATRYPDLDLPDMFGNPKRLSALQGQVILVDFWSASLADSKINNAEFKDLYKQYSDKGFEIYQVSLDTDRSLWVTSVQEQRLPWLSLCDFQGKSSPAVHLYNVQKVPMNYLIASNGDIVAKNLYGDQLAAELKKLFD